MTRKSVERKRTKKEAVKVLCEVFFFILRWKREARVVVFIVLGNACGPRENVDRCVVSKMCGVNERR